MTSLEIEIPRLKNVLSRAKRSGDPVAVLEAVERTLAVLGTWPSGWASWRAVLDDAYYAWDATEAREADVCYDGSTVTERWNTATLRLS
jgi:hypothetical protein